MSLPTLRSVKVGDRTLIYYDSLMQALGIEPDTEAADRPKVVTINKALELSSLSRSTINRMIAAGERVNFGSSSRPTES